MLKVIWYMIKKRLRRGMRVAILPTYFCNYSCEYCARWTPEKLIPKTLGEWIVELEQLERVLKKDGIKIKEIQFNGGEPTLVPYFQELAGYIQSRGWLLMVLTNLWSVKPFDEIKSKNTLLLASYHHTETGKDGFLERYRHVKKRFPIVLNELGEKRLGVYSRLKRIKPMGEVEYHSLRIDPYHKYRIKCYDL